jgi:acetyl-CoA acetyltransferase
MLAGLPQSVAGMTVNRFCGSSMQSVHIAAGAIQLGAGEVFIAAGIESMSRVPMLGFNPLPNPVLQAKCPRPTSAWATPRKTSRRNGISAAPSRKPSRCAASSAPRPRSRRAASPQNS